jgi:hypothetical protein
MVVIREGIDVVMGGIPVPGFDVRIYKTNWTSVV